MTKKTRTKLFLFFCLAFLIITPLTALYAAGYKINLTWPPKFGQTLQKTGMFIFDTQPRGAKIYLDGKLQQKFFDKYFSLESDFVTTPTKIKNVLPGQHDIKIELDGYWPWTKKLEIHPGESTYAEDINLFKKNLPLSILGIKNPLIKQSPDSKYLALINDKKIYALNQETEEIIEFPDLIDSSLENKILWAPDSQKFIADLSALKDNKAMFDLANQDKPILLKELVKKNIDNVKWGNNKIYYQYKNSINSFDLNYNVNNTIFSGENYLDYLVSDNYIFIIAKEKTDNSIKLRTYSTKNLELITEIDLPLSSGYELTGYKYNLLNLYDSNHQILYLINPASLVNPLKEIINNVKYTQWIDSQKLLYANDFEVWLFDLSQGQKNILTRISYPIIGIAWHPSNNYIFYATENSLNIIELDQREKRNITELIWLQKITSIHLNKKGNALYFQAQIGNQEGLYKLEIH